MSKRWRSASIKPEPFQPLGGDPAGGGLPLADLVAVDDQHVGAGPGQLPRHRQAGEAGAADQHVVGAFERGPLVASFGCAAYGIGTGSVSVPGTLEEVAD